MFSRCLCKGRTEQLREGFGNFALPVRSDYGFQAVQRPHINLVMITFAFTLSASPKWTRCQFYEDDEAVSFANGRPLLVSSFSVSAVGFKRNAELNSDSSLVGTVSPLPVFVSRRDHLPKNCFVCSQGIRRAIASDSPSTSQRMIAFGSQPRATILSRTLSSSFHR